MQTLKINKNWTLTIPKAFRSHFKTSDELACFVEGDTLIIKRINPPKLSELADRVKEKPVPLKEIVKEVHAYRTEKRQNHTEKR
jgi:bifunctional DNA-binding transcriptional regulator/antitoxin component of YhaV-PrlF toxin-antitoxin module